jgi:hypothetical protein
MNPTPSPSPADTATTVTGASLPGFRDENILLDGNAPRVNAAAVDATEALRACGEGARVPG